MSQAPAGRGRRGLAGHWLQAAPRVADAALALSVALVVVPLAAACSDPGPAAPTARPAGTPAGQVETNPAAPAPTAGLAGAVGQPLPMDTPTPDPFAAYRRLADAQFDAAARPLEDAPASLATARVLEAMGQVDDARDAYVALTDATGPAAAGAAVALAGLDIDAGDPSAALDALLAAGGQNGAGLPAEGLYRLGQALDAIGEHSGAARAYAAFGLAVPAMAAPAEMAEGNALFAAGDYRDAATAFARAAALYGSAGASDAFLATLRRGNALLRIDTGLSLAAYEQAFDMAQTDTQRAQALDGQIAAHTQAGDPAAANAARLRIVTELPDTELAAAALIRLDENGIEPDVLSRARVLEASGDHASAVSLLSPSASEGTLAPEGRLVLAEAYKALEQDDAALEQLDQVVSEADSVAAGRDEAAASEAAWLRASWLYGLGRLQDAMDASLTLADRWPRSAHAAEALRKRAAAALATDGPSAAVAALDLVVARYPDAPESGDDAFRAAFLAWYAGGADASTAPARLAAHADYGDDAARSRAEYWLGRLAFEAGDERAADHWQRAVALDPLGYYGLRALQRLGSAWPAPAAGTGQASTDAWLATWLGPGSGTQLASGRSAADSPAVVRAASWLALGQRKAALREMGQARLAANDDPAAELAIARRARELGLVEVMAAAAERVLALAPDAARSAAPAEVWQMAFPAGYADEVRQFAAADGLPEALLWAVVRQESRFEPTARSSAGALGLTQVMPGTASSIAQALGVADFQDSDLLQPDLALRFGAWYVSQQLERYDGRTWAALAAYNAGPGNGDRWLAMARNDQDVFVEIVDFPETRAYLRRCLVNLARYEWLYPDERQ